MNEIIKLEQLETEIKKINHLLMGEKRKTYKLKLQRQKTKLLKQYKFLKQKMVDLHNKRELNIWLIDITSVSVSPSSKKNQKYLKLGKYHDGKNMLIAYNFKLMKGYAILTCHKHITRQDLVVILSKLPQDAIAVTDSMHRYTYTLKGFTTPIKRLFAWIKKPIYTQLKKAKINTIQQLVDMYKQQLNKWSIETINF